MKKKNFVLLVLLLFVCVVSYSQQVVTVNVNPTSCFTTQNVNLISSQVLKCEIIPNPNNGVFSLLFRTSEISKTLHLKIYNIYGQLVYSLDDISSKKENISISIPELPSGVYCMSISSTNIYYQKKFIKY